MWLNYYFLKNVSSLLTSLGPRSKLVPKLTSFRVDSSSGWRTSGNPVWEIQVSASFKV